MKIFDRKITIWGIWALILVALIMCVILQNIQIESSLMKCIKDSLIFCSIPYLFFTTFYVAIIVSKQRRKIMYIFLIDVISSTLVFTNIGYFYEGPSAAKNSFLAIAGVMFIKGMILFIKKPNTSC